MVPVLTMVVAIVVVWYGAAIGLNAQLVRDQFAVADRAAAAALSVPAVPPAPGAATPIPPEAGPVAVAAAPPVAARTAADFITAAWALDRPKLPAPHQVATEFWNSTAKIVADAPGSLFAKLKRAFTLPRSLLTHAWVTLSATLAGFGFGVGLGILLAVGIVHSQTLDRGLMPWIVSSQMIPILALAPIIVVGGYNLLQRYGLPVEASRFLSKALISTFLSFFPVVVGMVKGFRSPEPIQLDLMRTYSATRRQTFGKLRWPAAAPFLFVSLKVAVAASLVGAIVGELPTGAVAGLGARILNNSYYGQTSQIWAALFMASFLAAALIALVGVAERFVLRGMGMARP